MLTRVELTRRSFLGLTTLLVGACQPLGAPQSIHELVFLTREGCVHAGMMRERLDTALKELRWPSDYQIIDAETLSSNDHRRGYPTPTLLYKNRDLFGMTEPGLSNPEST
jgi:hypothetical protein